MMRLDHPGTTVFAGTPITPSELVDLAEHVSPPQYRLAQHRLAATA